METVTDDDRKARARLTRGETRRPWLLPHAALAATVIVTVTVGCKDPGAVASQPAEVSPTVELVTGVLVDPPAQRVYTMRPGGGIQALQLRSGQPLWSSEAADVPLQILDGSLLAWRERRAGVDGDAASIVTLEAVTSGDLVASAPLPLPSDVRATVDRRADERFTLTLETDDGIPLLRWFFVRTLASAMPPSAAPTKTRAEAAGALHVDIVGQELSVLPLENSAAQTKRAVTRAPPPSGKDIGRRVSCDGRHLTITRVAEPPDPVQPYRWSVYTVADNKRIGKIAALRTIAAFLVVDGLLVHEVPPYGQASAKGWIEHPRSLAGIELAGGDVVWTHPIRDPEYRGPQPAQADAAPRVPSP